MAALNGYFDCVQLLLDLHANVSAVTFHYGTSMDLIGIFLGNYNIFKRNRFSSLSLYTILHLRFYRRWEHSAALCCLWRKCEVLPGDDSTPTLKFEFMPINKLHTLVSWYLLLTCYVFHLQILLSQGASRLSLNCNG